MISYTIRDKCVFLESDSPDNPIVPHFDSQGNIIAKFEPPYTIVEGVSAKISGKTITLFMSGKKGNFITFKLPAEAILCLASAIEQLSSGEDNIISKSMLEDIKGALENIKE